MVARATLLSTFLMLTALPAAAQSNGRTLTSPAERSADETAVPPAPGAPAESTSGLRYPSATNAARIRLTPEVEPTVRLSSRTMTRIRSLDAGLPPEGL